LRHQKNRCNVEDEDYVFGNVLALFFYAYIKGKINDCKKEYEKKSKRDVYRRVDLEIEEAV
jgi:hypothetical protein